jgi:hypothetical protein
LALLTCCPIRSQAQSSHSLGAAEHSWSLGPKKLTGVAPQVCLWLRNYSETNKDSSETKKYLSRTFWFLNRVFFVSESWRFGFRIAVVLVAESVIMVSESVIMVSESYFLVSES